MTTYKYIFGPVLSRRLGLSLGIDLLPFKTCSLNCVYCECGATTNLTMERREYVPTDEVLRELDDYLFNNPKPDYITFSGSGEPTLHLHIGKIIKHIKKYYPGSKIAVLTNSTLLHDPDVRQDILEADLVMPSLDAVSKDVFDKILRANDIVTPDIILKGIVEFRKMYRGILILEYFVVPGINDTANELSLLKKAMEEIGPDGIQINSLDRPGAVQWIQASTDFELQRIYDYLRPLPVQIIRRKQPLPDNEQNKMNDEAIITLLNKKNRTLPEIVNITGGKALDLNKSIGRLLKKNSIRETESGSGIYMLNS